jgi:hypothetical protein
MHVAFVDDMEIRSDDVREQEADALARESLIPTSILERVVWSAVSNYDDLAIGAELFSLRKQNSGIPWYAIFPREDAQVRRMYSRHFAIEQINRTLEDFLTELDARVNFIPPSFKFTCKHHLQKAGAIQ